ncbi:hypothetical protein VNO77_27553 [Canavalia gladiata]|uniref:Uncharacterized protein n=1 Tax=Canavalia gladiata TaxID=3824 RepID=A0AAN9KUW5_CANGL
MHLTNLLFQQSKFQVSVPHRKTRFPHELPWRFQHEEVRQLVTGSSSSLKTRSNSSRLFEERKVPCTVRKPKNEARFIER